MSIPVIFDRHRLFQTRRRAAAMPDDHGFLRSWVQDNIADRLDVITRDFIQRLDITPAHDPFDGDEVLKCEQTDYDLITSALTLHTMNDLAGALIQIRRALKPDGAFIGAMLGDSTLHELRASITATEIAHKGGISPRIFPMADKQDIGALMQRAGFALPVVDSERVSVTYDSLSKLVKDLRGMGESNILAARNKSYTGRPFWQAVEEHYKTHHSDENGRLVATFDIIFMLGWAPHDSQQKPLPRGSGEVHMGDVL